VRARSLRVDAMAVDIRIGGDLAVRVEIGADRRGLAIFASDRESVRSTEGGETALTGRVDTSSVRSGVS
jgi:hypothetical protein